MACLFDFGHGGSGGDTAALQPQGTAAQERSTPRQKRSPQSHGR